MRHSVMRAGLMIAVLLGGVFGPSLRADGPAPPSSADRAARAAAAGKTSPAPPGAPASEPARSTAGSVDRTAEMTAEAQTAAGSVTEIPLRTKDGHTFFADVYEPASAVDGAGILLVPDLGKTRKDLAPLAALLRDRGYRVYSMDNTGQLRNVSTRAGMRIFTPVDSRAIPEMVFDVAAAGHAMESHPGAGRYLAIGFGIGANLALQYAGETDRLAGVALVMPGFGCENVDPYEALNSLRNRPALLVEMKKRQITDLSRAFHAIAMKRKDLQREQIFIDRTTPPGQEPQTWQEGLVRDRLIDWTTRTLPPSSR